MQAITVTELEEIRRFRYRIYVEELGKPLASADHVRRALNDPLDDGAQHFYCRNVSGAIVGSARLHLSPTSAFPDRIATSLGIELFLAEHALTVCFISMLMIDPSLRGRGVVVHLLSHIYRKARDQGVAVCFNHCRPKWVPLYEKLGLRRFGRAFHDRAAGAQVPMVLVIEDVAHYRHRRSPLLADCLRYENDSLRAHALRDWFVSRMAWEGTSLPALETPIVDFSSCTGT